MKIPILLKVLQISATKANPNYKNTASRKGDQGFTLLEVLVIALIIGIFSSIAAPSWVAFINRQRVRTVNDRVFQSLRLAQSEAKRTKREVTVTFSAPSVDPPTITFNPPLATGGSTQTLNSGGEIKPGTIKLVSNATSITFDYLGNVKDQLPLDTSNSRRFVATASTVNGAAKQCAIVETIIGGMRTAEGNNCTTVP
ncbi:GspH/FimT family pseudopilin [Microcoleus sp. Pol14C2]|uniref:GspH/FimT family pseudopilin n=1 Tax=unclassified Microcoleus TaxID=2642155 RepID=UPI002FCFD423